jgi:alkanesulfonate monooxygenase SsuD/methylene tetrahydromethanopterin reductase-like flavin-dependent oxidoreductase (luciferase family)
VLSVYWPSTKWGELREQLDEGARKAGRLPHSAAIAPYITSFILDENATEEDRQEARRKAAMPLAYYIGRMGVYYAQMLTRNGFGKEVEAVQEGWKTGLQAALDAVTPALLDSTSIIGTPAEIVARLDQWTAAGVDEPILTMPAGTPDEAGPKLAAVMSALRS